MRCSGAMREVGVWSTGVVTLGTTMLSLATAVLHAHIAHSVSSLLYLTPAMPMMLYMSVRRRNVALLRMFASFAALLGCMYTAALVASVYHSDTSFPRSWCEWKNDHSYSSSECITWRAQRDAYRAGVALGCAACVLLFATAALGAQLQRRLCSEDRDKRTEEGVLVNMTTASTRCCPIIADAHALFFSGADACVLEPPLR
ncbi:MAG: hypothetical protein EOO65_02680 [Methanosarcinales archaeon]|nr:MAG: hypothetical protein EOO65_02680 [Methanosarcinales archaeon]